MEYLFIDYANFGVFGLFSLILLLFTEVMGLVYSIFIHMSTNICIFIQQNTIYSIDSVYMFILKFDKYS